MSSTADCPFADCHNRLIQAATEVFKEEGYRASVDRIATRASVARQTLYNHFPSKDELFGEVVRRATDSILGSLDVDGDAIRESLLRFGAKFRAILLGEDGLAVFRALIGEVNRFPALAEAFLANGPAKTTARLTDFLRRAMEKGDLRQDDPAFAAEMLMGMLSGTERTRRLCGQPVLAEAAELARLTRIVDCFLIAFAPERKD